MLNGSESKGKGHVFGKPINKYPTLVTLGLVCKLVRVLNFKSFKVNSQIKGIYKYMYIPIGANRTFITKTLW